MDSLRGWHVLSVSIICLQLDSILNDHNAKPQVLCIRGTNEYRSIALQ